MVFNAILTATPRPGDDGESRLPAGIDAILNKVVEKDRDMRYQTAGELKTDLKRLKRDYESSRRPAAENRGGLGRTVAPRPWQNGNRWPCFISRIKAARRKTSISATG